MEARAVEVWARSQWPTRLILHHPQEGHAAAATGRLAVTAARTSEFCVPRGSCCAASKAQVGSSLAATSSHTLSGIKDSNPPERPTPPTPRCPRHLAPWHQSVPSRRMARAQRSERNPPQRSGHHQCWTVFHGSSLAAAAPWMSSHEASSDTSPPRRLLKRRRGVARIHCGSAVFSRLPAIIAAAINCARSASIQRSRSTTCCHQETNREQYTHVPPVEDHRSACGPGPC